MSEDEPDDAYVERCIRGDLEAFGTLIERYQRQIFRAVLHMVGNYEDAREVTQQVFLKAFEHLSSYDRERKFFSWIYRIAMNESINYRKAQRPFEQLGEDTEGAFTPSSEPAETFDRNRAVRQAVSALKPEYRAVVVLRHFLDCSYRDAAEALQLPEKTVKSRLFAARQLLKAALAPATTRSTQRW
jgi:RNA polymerase sigma-70 factor (ECF subfamily)